MTEALPWDDIARPAEGYTVRLVEESRCIPIFWARDSSGRDALILRLASGHRERFVEGRPSLQGLDVDLLGRGDGTGEDLVLTVSRNIDRDLFHALCRSVVDAVARTVRADLTLDVALSQLRRWKSFLSGAAVSMLSASEIRGLYAELLFLEGLIGGLGPRGAVEAWTGPDRVHQDFVWADRAVEVKSVSATERSVVRISSEDQLESTQPLLFLVAYRLVDDADAGGRSLNDLVRDLDERIGGEDGGDDFASKLSAAGYAPRSEYDRSVFRAAGVDAFAVGEGFPRLVRSDLPAGVSGVRYAIALEAMVGFERGLEEVRGFDAATGF